MKLQMKLFLHLKVQLKVHQKVHKGWDPSCSCGDMVNILIMLTPRSGVVTVSSSWSPTPALTSCWNWWRQATPTVNLGTGTGKKCQPFFAGSSWKIEEGMTRMASRWLNMMGNNQLCPVNQVLVGSTVDLYCQDYWKKPKKDSWDDDKWVTRRYSSVSGFLRYDGILTALCQPNLKFSVPYDISRYMNDLTRNRG